MCLTFQPQVLVDVTLPFAIKVRLVLVLDAQQKDLSLLILAIREKRSRRGSHRTQR
jgi:hypothetical protein